MSDVGWLVPPERRAATPNIERARTAYEGIVYHYTASRGLRGTIAWLRDPKARASAHFVVDRNGEVWQLASVFDRTWHAGGQTSRFLRRSSVNQRTLGVEIMNLGPLGSVGGPGLSPIAEADRKPWPGAFGFSRGLYWEAYPPEQIAAVVELTKALVAQFPEIAGDAELRRVGHEHVDPTRKRDPGPLFPWSEIYAA